MWDIGKGIKTRNGDDKFLCGTKKIWTNAGNGIELKAKEKIRNDLDVLKKNGGSMMATSK